MRYMRCVLCMRCEAEGEKLWVNKGWVWATQACLQCSLFSFICPTIICISPLIILSSSPILISHIASYYPHNSTLPRIDCSKHLLIVDFFAFTLTSSAPVTWSLVDTFQICRIASRLVLPPKLRYVFQDSFKLWEIRDFTEPQNILIFTTLHTIAYVSRLSYKLVQCSHHFKTILIPTIFLQVSFFIHFWRQIWRNSEIWTWVRDTTVLVVWKL